VMTAGSWDRTMVGYSVDTWVDGMVSSTAAIFMYKGNSYIHRPKRRKPIL
jgi:hypothetical protein